MNKDKAENIFTEPAAELYAKALAAGFPISEKILAKWHRAGLLPKPIQQSLGRGAGTKTMYPAGTGNQLIALLKIRARERNYEVIGWRLWWLGYEVDEKYWHLRLQKSAKWADRIILFLKRRAFDEETDFEYLSDKATDTLEEKAFIRSSLVFWRRTRKNIGRKSMELFGKYILQIMVGKFKSEKFGHRHDDKENKIDAFILMKGLGFKQKKEHSKSAGIELDHVLQELNKFSHLLGTHTLLSAAEWEPAIITSAQRELISIIKIVLYGGSILSRLNGSSKGLKVFSNIFTSDNIFLQNMLLLCFIILKHDADKDTQIKAYLNPVS